MATTLLWLAQAGRLHCRTSFVGGGSSLGRCTAPTRALATVHARHGAAAAGSAHAFVTTPGGARSGHARGSKRSTLPSGLWLSCSRVLGQSSLQGLHATAARTRVSATCRHGSTRSDHNDREAVAGAADAQHRHNIARDASVSDATGAGAGAGAGAGSDESERELYKDQDDTWVDRHTPPAVRPYLKLIRIDRPVGTWLLMWPGWWSIALAAPAHTLPDAKLLATFAVGAFVMRGAGCTINDMWDKDFDGKVARTKLRPIASGAVSRFQALVFLGGQLSVGLAILCTLNNYSIALGAASVGLVVAYPLMKRVTHWPQLILGLTFNWGALLGWSAVAGSVFWPAALPLYGAGVAWTIVYDTLYAHQDKEDDARVGLKSTALYLGDRTVPVLTAISALSTAGFVAAGVMADAGWPYYLGVAAASAHMLWQVHTADLEDRWSLTTRFVSNKWTGALVFAGAVAGSMLPLAG